MVLEVGIVHALYSFGEGQPLRAMFDAGPPPVTRSTYTRARACMAAAPPQIVNTALQLPLKVDSEYTYLSLQCLRTL